MSDGTPSWLTSFCAAETPACDWLSESSTTISSSRPSMPTSFTSASARSFPRWLR